MTKTMMGAALTFLLVACGGDPATSTEGAGGERGPNAVASSEQLGDGNEAAAPSSTPSTPAPAPAPAPSSDPAPSDPPKPAPADCSTRNDGAVITFNKGNETWTVWITNSKFNTEAFLASVQGKLVTPVFTGLHDGMDCDGQFTWHVDAENVAFEADYDASCDAMPSAVEADKATWLASKRWCPSKVLVSSYAQQ